MGDSPTLTTVKFAYSQEIAETWIMSQIEDLNDFCGVKNKASNTQMEDLSRMIIAECHYLKVSELMLFFYRFKLGHYGEFYGVVDPHKIMCSLNLFLKERFSEINKYEAYRKNEEMKKKRELWEKTGITREEYEKRKAKKIEDNKLTTK